jgi:hypothetical protein
MSVKRAYDSVFVEIPEELYRHLLFSSSLSPDRKILESEAGKVVEAIRATMNKGSE